VSDVSLPGNKKESFLAGLLSTVKENRISSEIRAHVQAGGSYKLLRVHVVDKRPRALFRFLSPEGGLNYHDVIPMRDPDGRMVAEDIHVYLSGETLGQTYRRNLLPGLIELTDGGREKLSETEKQLIDSLPKIDAFNKAMQAGDMREAVKIYKGFPGELQQVKVFVLGYVRAAAGVDHAELLKALEKYRKLFPTDPAIDLVSVTYYALTKKYDLALRSVDPVEKAIGGDPYLHVLRANILLEANRIKDARAAAEKAIEQEPGMTAAYWSRIGVSLHEKNHAETLLWLKKVAEKTTQEIGDLGDAPDYQAFVKSPQHAEWVKWYAMRKK
jgi:tetratricopeptide (TPR) repeat protein